MRDIKSEGVKTGRIRTGKVNTTHTVTQSGVLHSLKRLKSMQQRDGN